jgi:hypothetical protein
LRHSAAGKPSPLITSGAEVSTLTQDESGLWNHEVEARLHAQLENLPAATRHAHIRKMKLATQQAGRLILTIDEAMALLTAKGLHRTHKRRVTKDNLVTQAARGFGSLKSLSDESGIPLSSLNTIQQRGGGTYAMRFVLALLAASPKSAIRLCRDAKRWLNDVEG